MGFHGRKVFGGGSVERERKLHARWNEQKRRKSLFVTRDAEVNNSVDSNSSMKIPKPEKLKNTIC